MNWQDYKCMSHNHLDEIGLLKEDYVYVHKIQSGMTSEFRYITKDEFSSYEDWKDNTDFLKKLHLRDISYIGYFGHHEFRKK